MNQQKKYRLKHYFHFIFLFAVWLVIFGVIGILLAFIYFARQIPDPETIITRRVSESTKIYDRTGDVLLYDVFGEERRTIVPLENVSAHIKQAVIIAEDNNFYSHKGLDLTGIIRALFRDIRGGAILQGGSTITQQLIKNSLLGAGKGFSGKAKRKIKEAILSIEIERKFDKDQILWMYLNQIPFGSTAYGIETASQTYFSKSANVLTLKESVILAAMIKAPSYLSPFGTHREELLARSETILKKMLEKNLISKEEFDWALIEKPVFSGGDRGILAPHFVIMVREQLIKKYGEDKVQNGGLRVYTTLDWNKQQIAEEVIKKYGEKNEKAYKASNAALVAINPKSGEILTMVGSRDYFNIDNEGNFNVATALRQPGSAFKPLAYATAIEKGIPDTTIVFDVKTEFNPNCQPEANQMKDQYGLDCYHPQNYDSRYRGPVSMRRALGNSLNVPSVKLLYLAGIENTIQQAQKMGLSSLNDPSRFGLSLVLGGAEVSLLELTSAYGVFAQEGIYAPPFSILKVETSDGEILEEYNLNVTRALSENTALTVTDILSDNSARTQIFGPSSLLFFSNRSVAAKTGTTQNNRDAWILGFTPSFVAGAWVGNNNNSPMTREGAGISAAGPLWHEFMVKALAETPPESFKQPEPLFSEKPILNGQLSDPNFGIHNILFFLDKNDPHGSIPSDPYEDVQYQNWEWAVQNWFNNPAGH